VEGSCGHGKEPPDFIKRWHIPEWLHNWQLLKQCSPLQHDSRFLTLLPHFTLSQEVAYLLGPLLPKFDQFLPI
jgi:hypothetical protein